MAEPVIINASTDPKGMSMESPPVFGSTLFWGDRLTNHALFGRGALDVAYVLVGVGVIVVVLVLGVVVLVLAELVLDYLLCVMLFVLVGVTVIVVAVGYVLVGVSVIVVVLVLAVIVVVLVFAVNVIVLVLTFVLVGVSVIVVVLVLAIVVVAFVLANDADHLLIPTAARRCGAIPPGGRACSASSSCGARSLLAGPEGISVSQVGRLRGEVNHDCLRAVVADGDVLLDHTVA